MFFGASGSMAGGQMKAVGRLASPGTYSRRWKIVASYMQSHGVRKASTSRFGCERSMWQRQIQWRAASRAYSTIAHGWDRGR